jgi:hypothetical protein
MKIIEMFKRELDRPINGVVKADQLDPGVIWTELDEYKLTKELDRHLRRFLEAYTASLHHPTDSMGVWVSGFFGSGKSHFIKILSYLLEKKSASNPQSGVAKDAVKFFDEKVSDKALFGEILQATSKPTDVILFNIDAKADRKWDNAVLQVFLRVFNEMAGYSADFPALADMERHLQAEGQLAKFEAAYEAAAGKAWKADRAKWRFKRKPVCEALAKAMGTSVGEAETWFKNAEDDFALTPEKFAAWVKAYLDQRGPDHRVVFFADEVGQFIGNNTHLMLSLQTIAEQLGSKCGGRAWVVVTSQEDIDAVLGEFRSVKEQDFSKIQGRFKTRLSLSSSNTDEVISARLLEKNDDATAALTKRFEIDGHILKNQISFTGTKKKFSNYSDGASFAAVYPFAPYHFELLQKVFEAVRRAGATGVHLSRGERSLLDAFQTAALSIKDRALGALVPLYRFYPAIEGFLDTTVERTISQARDSQFFKHHPFDIEVLRTLFLIRYVDEIPGNVDNLVTLCLAEIDQDKLALRKEIEESLDRLESQNLISRSGDVYAFLTSEEQDVGREIKKTEVTPSEENRKVAELVYRDALKDKNKHKFKDNKTDYAFTRYCDGHLFGSKKEEDVVVSVVTPFMENYEGHTPPVCVLQSTEYGGQLLLKLPERERLLQEVRQYLKTDKYIRHKTDDSNPETLKRILRDRADENRERDSRLRSMVEEMIGEATVYAAGQTLDLKAKSADALVSEGIDYVIRNTFIKMGLLGQPSKDASAAQQETQAVLAANDVQKQIELGLGQEAPNAKASQELLQYVKLTTAKNHQLVLSEVVERYERRPYGWPTYDIVLLVARLFVAGELTLRMDGSVMSPSEAKEPLSKGALWKKVTLKKRATTPTETIQKARQLGKDLFEAMSLDGEQEVHQFFQKKLGEWRDEFQTLSGKVSAGHYPGVKVVQGGVQTTTDLLQIHEPTEFFDELLKRRNDLLNLADDRRDVLDFFKNQSAIWDQLRAAVNSTYKANSHALMHRETAKQALAEIHGILNNHAPYGLLNKANALLQTLASENQTAVETARPECVAKIEDALGHVRAAVADAEKQKGQALPADLKNQVLHGLQVLFQKAKESQEIPTIQDARNRSDDEMDTAIQLVENWAQPEKKDKQRPVKQLDASSLMKNKPYLESTTDVEDYIAALKTELLHLVQTHRVKLK